MTEEASKMIDDLRAENVRLRDALERDWPIDQSFFFSVRREPPPDHEDATAVCTQCGCQLDLDKTYLEFAVKRTDLPDFRFCPACEATIRSSLGLHSGLRSEIQAEIDKLNAIPFDVISKLAVVRTLEQLRDTLGAK